MQKIELLHAVGAEACYCLGETVDWCHTKLHINPLRIFQSGQEYVNILSDTIIKVGQMDITLTLNIWKSGINLITKECG